MKRHFVTASAIFAWICLAYSVSPAIDRGEFIISGGPCFTPIIGGEASSGDSSPDYNGIFKNGWGIGLDGMFVITNRLRAGFGFSVSVFRGDNLEGEDVGKWWVAPMLLGAQVFPLGSKHGSLRPYLRADIGMTFYGAVQVDNPGGETDLSLFRTSTAFAADAGGGLEWIFSERWGVFAEVRYLITGHPIGGGDIPIHDPDSVSFLPIRLGLTYEY